MIVQHPFELPELLVIGSVINPIGVEEEKISWTHQRELGHIGGVRPGTELQ